MCVHDNYSSWSSVTSGVPQGSVLGPILFIIYITDLPNFVLSSLWSFADDAKISAQIWILKCCKMILMVDGLVEWSETWQAFFNITKCKAMTISNASEVRHYTMHTNSFNETISSTNEETDLGVLFTTDLKFSRHVNNIILKANRTLALIRHTFHIALILTYLRSCMSVLPQLDYLSSVWNPHQLKDIRALENVQRCATRLIPSFKLVIYPDHLTSLNLPSLLYRRRRMDMLNEFLTNSAPTVVTTHLQSQLTQTDATVTLSCKATVSGPIRYQSRRVNGEVNSDRAEGVNTSTLTISPVQQEDEDEYYCIASSSGGRFTDTSNVAVIAVVEVNPKGNTIVSFNSLYLKSLKQII